MQRLSIEYQPLGSLKLRTANPRTHSDKQIDQIAKSIQRFGFTNPIVADDEDNIVAGEGRYKAAKRLGFCEVPLVRLSAMSEAEIRAYVIADNKLAENAGWDRNLLALELQYLSDLGLDDLDVTITGFELPEIDVLIGELSAANNSVNEAIEPAPGPAVTRLGDIWQIADRASYR
jgi:ParB-like chromosome segregation protein Spo0J